MQTSNSSASFRSKSAYRTAKCLEEKPFYSKHGGRLRRKRGAYFRNQMGQGVGYADSVGSAIFGRVRDWRAGPNNQIRRQPEHFSIAGPKTGSPGDRRSEWPNRFSDGGPHIIKERLKPNYNEALDVTVAFVSAAKPDIPEEDLKPKIFITGEVIRPGSYVVRQKTTLMQAIALAGGLGPFAAKRRLQVRRRGIGGDETIFAFDYRAYEAGYDLEGNVTLRPGDVVIVPERGLFE